MAHRYTICSLAAFGLLIPFLSFGQIEPTDCPPGHHGDSRTLSAAGSPMQSVINVGNFTHWVGGTGASPVQVEGEWSGSFPSNYPVGVIRQEGLVWGGLVSDGSGPALRVGGSVYQSSLTPGRIFTNASGQTTGRENSSAADVRVFRVRRDWQAADLTEDAALTYQTRPVTSGLINAVRGQYQKDWNEWPWQKGAPFVDRNSNGTYEPGTDIPGVLGADQTIWYVANDLDPSVAWLFGTPPIGLEVQVTYWAYNRSRATSRTIFKRVKLIYKGTITATSGASISDMYIGQWVDPAIGDFFDDYVGCDPNQSLAFAYEGLFKDRAYTIQNLPPPCLGVDLLQGPIVPASGARAIVNNSYKWGYWNVPMTSFIHFGAGRKPGEYNASSIRPYPMPWYSDTCGRGWYNMMRGGEPYPIYPAFRALRDGDSDVTKFELASDPPSWGGDMDGRRFWHGERSFVMGTGPFSMAKGDTQEVVLAFIAGMGTDYRNCFWDMRESDQLAQSMYNNLFRTVPPGLFVQQEFDGSGAMSLRLVADARNLNISSLSVTIRKHDWSWMGNVQLYDDGLHRDSAAGDQIYGNVLSLAQSTTGLFASIDASYATGSGMTFHYAAENIPGTGPVQVVAYPIESDNINSDKQANPGEDIRYTVSIRNNSSGWFGKTHLTTQLGRSPRTLFIPAMNGNATTSLVYDANDDSTFFSFDIPGDWPDSVFTIPLKIWTESQSAWKTTLRFPIRPFRMPVTSLSLNHTGASDWNFGVTVVDPTAIQPNHNYRITIGEWGSNWYEKNFSLRDQTTGQTLLSNLIYPDQYGHAMPVVDGFKIVRGRDFGVIGIRKDSTRWISQYPAWFRGFHYTIDSHAAFDGGVTTGAMVPVYFYHVRSSFDPGNSVPVEVRFDASKPQKAYRVQRIGPEDSTGNAYLIIDWPSFTDVPFTVWDVSDRANPRQLTVAFRDQNWNGIWDPQVNNDNYEMVFIYYKSYDPTGSQYSYPPNAIPDEATVGPKADIMYQLGICVIQGHKLNENPGTLYIRPYMPPRTSDVYSFTMPRVPLTSVDDHSELPKEFKLVQNYPNPFNPQTTIKYELPNEADVVLVVYNLLGQEVERLVNERQEAGRYEVNFNASNLASGIYFYRIKAGNFVSVRKMMLLR